MSIQIRTRKIEESIIKREARCRAYIEKMGSTPSKKSSDWAEYLIAQYVQLGWMPPLPDGCQSYRELVKKSKPAAQDYLKNLETHCAERAKCEEMRSIKSRLLILEIIERWADTCGDKI